MRYAVVAFVALFVDMSGLIFLKEIAGLNYLLAATLSFILGLTTNYVLSVYWVFHSSKLDNKRMEFFFFAIIGVIGLVLTDTLLWILTSKLGLYYILSKAIAVIMVYFWNFGMRKYYLFN